MTTDEMKRMTDHTDNVAEKIRILFRAGVERADIARALGKRYQHVHNVLKRSGLLGDAAQPGPDPTAGGSTFTVLTLGKSSQVTLPEDFVREAGLREGDILMCSVESDAITIMTREKAASLLMKAAQQHMPGQAGLLSTLLGRDPRSRSG